MIRTSIIKLDREKTIMRSMPILFILLITSYFAQPNFARTAETRTPEAQNSTNQESQAQASKTFSTPGEACHALFEAIQKNDDSAVEAILGVEKQTISSGNETTDKQERERFIQKYREMHRLVREPDGTTQLYIGAENWPFPFPLISKNGRWYFDSATGKQEILFRRIGENESDAMEICHTVAEGNKQQDAEDDDAVVRYAQTLISSRSENNASTSANEDKPSAPFHGYCFRPLTVPQNGSKPSANRSNTAILIAYPAEYRVSGVQTFLVTPSGTIYQRDLGPDTEKLAKSTTTWKPDSKWHQSE